jgi:uncharacterized membrane protein (UPF0127 family)
MQTRARALRQVLAAATVAILAVACEPSGPSVAIHTAQGTARIAVELARTDAERQRGLMYREHLDDDKGMLFVFEGMGEHAFWMKNTLIPLDMIHIDDQRRIVGIVADATPLSTRPLSIGMPSAYVLEVRGGLAKARGMAVGDTVELIGIAP